MFSDFDREQSISIVKCIEGSKMPMDVKLFNILVSKWKLIKGIDY